MPKSFLLRRTLRDGGRVKEDMEEHDDDYQDGINHKVNIAMFGNQENSYQRWKHSKHAIIPRQSFSCENTEIRKENVDYGTTNNKLHLLLVAARQLVTDENDTKTENMEQHKMRSSLKSITRDSNVMSQDCPTERFSNKEKETAKIQEDDEDEDEGDDNIFDSEETNSNSTATDVSEVIDYNNNTDQDNSYTGLRKSKYQCNQCGKVFKTRYTLTIHLKMPIHTKSRPFVCSVCGKGFRLSSTLCRHKIIHTKEKPHGCHVCSKAFNRSSTLKTHLKTHSTVKEFVCHLCGKGFHQKGNLRNHSLIHTGERPYECTVCDKAFNKMSNLKFHLQIHEQSKDF